MGDIRMETLDCDKLYLLLCVMSCLNLSFLVFNRGLLEDILNFFCLTALSLKGFLWLFIIFICRTSDYTVVGNDLHLMYQTVRVHLWL